MTAVEQIHEVVGVLRCRIPAAGGLIPAGGPETPEHRLAALEHDVRALFKGLEWAGGQIDYLNEKVNAVVRLNNLTKP